MLAASNGDASELAVINGVRGCEMTLLEIGGVVCTRVALFTGPWTLGAEIFRVFLGGK
jgi:hypothetical protein